MKLLKIKDNLGFYLDEQGDVVERGQLKAIDGDGDIIAPEGTSPDAVLEVMEAAELLECGITRVYALEPVFICAELEGSLSWGTIYRLAECNGCRAFLLGNEAGYFLLIGKRTGFEFIGLAEADLSPPDLEAEDMDEDLDFCML